MEVGDWLVEHTAELNIQLAHNTIPCQAGLQFGSQYVVSPLEGQVFDYLPVEMFGMVRNLETFAGMLVMDKWTGNANGRQAAFWRKLRERKYTASFIDQGYCFNAGEWTFPDYPLRGVYARNEVYEGCVGGSRLNRGFRGSRGWQRTWSGVWRGTFLRSGTAKSGMSWRSWCGR